MSAWACGAMPAQTASAMATIRAFVGFRRTDMARVAFLKDDSSFQSLTIRSVRTTCSLTNTDPWPRRTLSGIAFSTSQRGVDDAIRSIQPDTTRSHVINARKEELGEVAALLVVNYCNSFYQGNGFR